MVKMTTHYPTHNTSILSHPQVKFMNRQSSSKSSFSFSSVPNHFFTSISASTSDSLSLPSTPICSLSYSFPSSSTSSNYLQSSSTSLLPYPRSPLTSSDKSSLLRCLKLSNQSNSSHSILKELIKILLIDRIERSENSEHELRTGLRRLIAERDGEGKGKGKQKEVEGEVRDKEEQLDIKDLLERMQSSEREIELDWLVRVAEDSKVSEEG